MFVIHLIAAARPNFMKVAPLYHELKKTPWAKPILVHTGQHYDKAMSDCFFEELGLPTPDFNLGVGAGSHAEQTGRVMIEYEKLCLEHRPNLVIVVGDVNSTLAVALVASKLLVPVAHLEAGLRSFDRTMPEEINRIVTDSISDILWTPSPDGDIHLRAAGIPDSRVDRVGNIMIDSLVRMKPQIDKLHEWEKHGFQPHEYAVVTLHRPKNVDSPEILKHLTQTLLYVSAEIGIIFPIHPRTRKNLMKFGYLEQLEQATAIKLCEPLTYTEFLSLLTKSRFALTDSGGIQEETTYLGIPCLTVRDNTERPITITEGTNRLVPLPDVLQACLEVLKSGVKKHRIPEFWDGRTAERVVRSIENRFNLTQTADAVVGF